MKVPPRKPLIDVHDARLALIAGETITAYARRNGYAPAAVRRALHRAGVRTPQRRSVPRDATDRRLYELWRSIRARCSSEASSLYRLWGAKGIRVCKEWQRFDAFRDWARSGGYRPSQSLALRVGRRGYSPSNCYWEDRSEAKSKASRASRTAIEIRAFGETKPINDWARDRRARVSGQTIRNRLRGGVRPELAITGKPGEVELGPVAARPSASAVPRRIDWERVRKLYVIGGANIADTAKRVGATYAGVYDGLRSRGWFRERAPAGSRKHGDAIQRAWQRMRERCYSPGSPGFAAVGGKGIRVAREWGTFDAFYAWALSAGYRPGRVLTRVDPGRGFRPKNCAWMSRRASIEFLRPAKAPSKPHWTVTAFGETKGPAAWVRDKRCDVSLTGLIHRLKRGMRPEEAITKPPRTVGKRDAATRLVRAFGERKSVSAWARDRRAKVTTATIARRLASGMDPEAAITRPQFGMHTVDARRAVRR